MITTTLLTEDEKTITLQLVDEAREKEYNLKVIKAEGYTVEQLVERWGKRAKLEYRTNRGRMFETFFVNRINRRHEKLAAEM